MICPNCGGPMTNIGTVQTKDHFECPPCFKEESIIQFREKTTTIITSNPRTPDDHFKRAFMENRNK